MGHTPRVLETHVNWRAKDIADKENVHTGAAGA